MGQIDTVLRPLAKAAGLTSCTSFGGVGQNPQVTAIRRGVDILVACPGRLEDLIGQGHCSLSGVRITVLDEADHMADLGFLPAVRRLLGQTPADGQLSRRPHATLAPGARVRTRPDTAAETRARSEEATVRAGRRRPRRRTPNQRRGHPAHETPACAARHGADGPAASAAILPTAHGASPSAQCGSVQRRAPLTGHDATGRPGCAGSYIMTIVP